MAGSDPYHLTDKAAVVAAWNELTEEGWTGTIDYSRAIDESSTTAKLKMGKQGCEPIDAGEGFVLRPMNDRTRFMKFTAEDYAVLFP